MPEIKVRVENLEKFEAALSQAPRIVARRLQIAVEKAGFHFLAKTKENIRTGRDMWKSPIDTGYMWNHIFNTVTPLRSEIVPTADYAIYVHQGTSRMRARPFLEITTSHEMNEIQDIFTTELDRALEEVANA